MTLDCGDRDSYGDDTMMWPGVVTNNLGPGTTSQLRPAETRIPESPGHQTADSQVLRHSGHLNWNYFNNHRNKMGTESRGKSETFILRPVLNFFFEPFENFLMRSIHQNDTIQSSLVVQPIQFRDFSGSV